MTYGACYWSFSDEEECEACNFQDSKQMSREARKILYENMIAKENVGFILRVLHASEISRNMLRKQPYNLNAMSHDAAMQMISSALHANVKVKKVYVDTVGNPDSYRAKLERAFTSRTI